MRLRFGSAWHSAIQKWYEAGTFDRQSLIASWAPIADRHFGYLSKRKLAKDLKGKAYPFLTNFVKKIHDVGIDRKPMLLEKGMTADIDAGWKITGRPDAIFQHGAPINDHGGGIIEVVDWKTGRGVKGEKTLRQDWQLRTYAYMSMRRWGVDRVLGTLHYVMANKRVSVMFTKQEIEGAVLRRYSRIADEIDQRKFRQANDKRCWDCPYAKGGKPCTGSPPAHV
jgi:CRISPR/Cas system-associated exonuclease Cas4 (RecB family)